MNEDLKLIKKYYGEETMHICRDFFPTILEEEGKLFSILDKHFAHDKHMLHDISDSELEIFKNFIFRIYHEDKNPPIDTHKTLKELLDLAGYDFYDCKTQEEILSFKRYYKSYESLCTFKDRRLNRYYVSFLVKKNVDDIKRKDFKNPQREDEYGTSVMSVQISRLGSHVSIKNRYNHTVNNPDATYGNDLERIIPGLTKAFENYYGIHIDRDNSVNNLVNFINADGKFYRFNYEINDIYYCSNNVVIENHHVIDEFLDKEKFLVFDYFVLDLESVESKKNKLLHDGKKVIDKKNDDNHKKSYKHFTFNEYTKRKILGEGLYFNLSNINKIEIIKNEHTKDVKLYDFENNQLSILTINANNQLIKFYNEGIKEVEPHFLNKCNYLKEISFKDAEMVNPDFLGGSSSLEFINMPNVERIYDNFCSYVKDIKYINFPKLKFAGNNFFETAKNLEVIDCMNLIHVGDYFLYEAKNLKEVKLPKLETTGTFFMGGASSLKSLYLPSLFYINHGFLTSCINLKNLYLPKVTFNNSNFDVSLCDIYNLKYIYSPDLYHAIDTIINAENNINIDKDFPLELQKVVRHIKKTINDPYYKLYKYLHSMDQHNDDISFMRVKKK